MNITTRDMQALALKFQMINVDGEATYRAMYTQRLVGKKVQQVARIRVADGTGEDLAVLTASTKPQAERAVIEWVQANA